MWPFDPDVIAAIFARRRSMSSFDRPSSSSCSSFGNDFETDVTDFLPAAFIACVPTSDPVDVRAPVPRDDRAPEERRLAFAPPAGKGSPSPFPTRYRSRSTSAGRLPPCLPPSTPSSSIETSESLPPDAIYDTSSDELSSSSLPDSIDVLEAQDIDCSDTSTSDILCLHRRINSSTKVGEYRQNFQV